MENQVASFSLMKRMNTAAVLRMVRAHGAASRAQIAKETGLTPATVTNITARLIGAGFLCEADRGESTGGRKPVLLRFSPGCCRIAAAYFGPDTVSLAIADFAGHLLCHNEQKLLPGDTVRQCVDFVDRQLRRFPEFDKVAALGVAVHGLVDAENGVSVFAPNLGWEGVPVRDLLKQRLDMPVYVENDVRLMTLSELWYGAAKKLANFAFVYVGAGIGGALVIDGKLYRGSGQSAGEIGHTTIHADGSLCSCGNRGCLQALAGEGALLQALRTAAAAGEGTCLPEGAAVADVVAAAQNGDALAVRLLSDEARYLGIGIANLANLFNPEAVVFAAGAQGLAEYLLPAVQREAGQRMIRNLHTDIRASLLGGTGSLRGGVALVLDYICDDPYYFLRV